MDIRLQDIERAVCFFQKPVSERSKENKKGLEWLWKRVSWSGRMLGSVGMQEQKWWYRRYVLPILCRAADAHLRRFLLGDWREIEERRLSTLFSFFSRVVVQNPEFFSREITDFLLGEAPSFSKERKTVQSLLSEKKKGYGSFSWYKDELFSQYQRRMRALHKRGDSSSKQSQENSPQETQDPLKPATKRRVKEFISEILVLKERIHDFYNTTLEREAKIFPLRAECGKTLSSIQDVQKKSFDLVITLDDLSSWIAEPFIDKEARRRLKEAKGVMQKISESFEDLCVLEQGLKKEGEGEQSLLQRQVRALSRKIDKLPSLPPSCSLKEQQLSVIKMARTRVKEFRTALVRGPGPNRTFQETEQEVTHFLKTAQALYDEGVEIEQTKSELTQLRKQVEKKESTKGLLDRIENILESLEVIANRKKVLAQIYDEVRALQ